MSSGLHIFAGPWQTPFVPTMNAALLIRLTVVTLVLTAPAVGRAEDKVATAVYASFVAMLKTAAPYFGRESGKLVRREETKGSVELGDLKFLGEAKEPEKSPTKENK